MRDFAREAAGVRATSARKMNSLFGGAALLLMTAIPAMSQSWELAKTNAGGGVFAQTINETGQRLVVHCAADGVPYMRVHNGVALRNWPGRTVKVVADISTSKSTRSFPLDSMAKTDRFIAAPLPRDILRRLKTGRQIVLKGETRPFSWAFGLSGSSRVLSKLPCA